MANEQIRSSRVATRPHARTECRGELAACDQPDDEGAQTESLMNMQRKHWHGHANDQKGDEHDSHDRD